MVGSGSREREKRKGKAAIDLTDGSSSGAVIVLSDSDSVGSTPGSRGDDGKARRVSIDLTGSTPEMPIQPNQPNQQLNQQNQQPNQPKQQLLDKELSKLLSIFPHACPRLVAADLARQLKKTAPGTAMERIVHQYIEHGVPKAQEVPRKEEPILGTEFDDIPQPIEKPMDMHSKPNVHGVGTSTQAGASTQAEHLVDIPSEVLPPEIQANYFLWSQYTLAKQFPRYPIPDLKRVLHENNARFAPSYKAISASYAAALAAEQNGKIRRRAGRRSGDLKLNIRPRDSQPKPEEPCHYFDREWQIIQNASGEGVEQGAGGSKTDTAPQVDAGEGETPADIECGCCCSDYRFEEMVQCAEGHLFCFTCLRRRVEESTFGGSKASNLVPCMDTSGCEESFPLSEVKRALPPNVLAKFEQRQAEDAVVQAKITGLVYCPFCNTPWEVDPDLRILECANESCKKASCVLCREPSHVPLRCEEVEKKSETSVRRSIEERMTKALLRVCSACKAELLKSDGCNKVTCRCGKTMCYVCRQPIAANYQHFCQHSRPGPKMPCTECKKCSLWEVEEEDEVVKAAREAAMKELAQEDPNLLKRTIGPKLEPAIYKKQKRPPIPAVPFRPPPPEYYLIAAQAMVHVAEQMM